MSHFPDHHDKEFGIWNKEIDYLLWRKLRKESKLVRGR
jgi:hypothetical protein